MERSILEERNGFDYSKDKNNLVFVYYPNVSNYLEYK